MDRIKKYQTILETFFEKRIDIQKRQKNQLRAHLVVNANKTDFVLLTIGWVGKKYIHTVTFHFEIKNEKIWIWEDKTDIDAPAQLVEAGVAKADIVLGFLSPLLREFSDYAVA